jgi:hypothetical protein
MNRITVSVFCRSNYDPSKKHHAAARYRGFADS